jgi:hypothetical protein
VGADRVAGPPGRPAARLWLSVTRAVVVAVAVAVVLALALAGCGSGATASTHRHAGDVIPRSLASAARPIGAGARFHPSARGPVSGRCSSTLGRRYGVHLELFAVNRVVLLAPGIGVGRPWQRFAGRITHARCYGPLATLDPTGVVLVRPGARVSVGDVFRAWGRPLGARRLLSFRARTGLRAYVDGRRWTRTAPAQIPLTRHAEIVLELGPYVPPHRSFAFPPGR